jgi:ubiquinone/menaquinone biosynthesis C-methylase UbiE
LWICLGLVASFVGIGFVWRLASRRHTIPCPVWLRWLVELDNPFTATNRAAVIIGHLGLRPGMTVLDVGCGPGRVTLPAAREVGPTGRVIAIDLQPGMLRRAQERARSAGLDNISFLEAGVGGGKLDVPAADRALLVTVLGEIPDREAALRSIFAALKPGGVLSITEIVFDPHFQRRATVSELARNAGFEEQAFYGNRIAYTLHLRRPLHI